MSNYFSEPAISLSFKNSLRDEVLSTYQRSIQPRSFGYYFSSKFTIPALCLIIFTGFLISKGSYVSSTLTIEEELLSISEEFNNDSDIQSALSFTETVTN